MSSQNDPISDSEDNLVASDSAEPILDSETTMKMSNTVEVLAEIGEPLPEEAFNPSDNRNLQIILDCPQKHVTPFETYVSYSIATKTTRTEYENQEYAVRRRYSDFEWLRHQLTHAYPSHIVPPLPEKHSLLEQIDRYDRSFILCRMQLLGRFLNRVADHPMLSCDKRYKAFLTEPPNDFSVFKRSNNSLGLFGRMSESLHNLATAYVTKGRTNEFEKMNEYILKLTEKISTMEKIGHRILKERIALVEDLQHIQPALCKWGESEPQLVKGLEAIGLAATTCSESEIRLIDKHRHNISVPLHEYRLYADAAKDALTHRDSFQIDYEVHMEQLCRVKAEQTQLEKNSSAEQPIVFNINMWRSPEQVQQHRIQQLSSASNVLAQQVESSRDKLECANENLRVDFERWNEVKIRDLKSILTEMADLHIKLYEESMTAWSNALPLVKN